MTTAVPVDFADPALEAAFKSLTPGRQKGYLFHFAQPKLAKTREARVEKYIPQILQGLGLDDDPVKVKK